MMVNRGLGSPSQRGGPDKLLMSPSGRDREFKLTLLVYDAGQRHIAERRATRLSSASTNGVIANSSANPPGLRRRATNAASRQRPARANPGRRPRPATGTRWRLWRRGISPQRRREAEGLCRRLRQSAQSMPAADFIRLPAQRESALSSAPCATPRSLAIPQRTRGRTAPRGRSRR